MEDDFKSDDIQNVVEMQGIIKRFPGVLANDNVDFTLRRAEIHALLGENGAGKSTLMNILAGLYKADGGKLLVNNERVSFSSPKDAINAGIGMVHQHFMLVPSQTVTENVILGLEYPKFHMNMTKLDNKIIELEEQFGLKVDPQAKIWQLSVGEQQRVEILKMLYRGAEILILDEPTAVLAPVEIEDLFNTLREMTRQGKSIIFISHKLNEVMEISDRVTVLQKGKVTTTGKSVKGTTRAELAKLMVGREVLFSVKKSDREPGKEVLKVDNIYASNDKGLRALNGISINVKAGEIVGVAGVAGNGQRELADVITGLRACESGKILVEEVDITNKSVKTGIKSGVSHVPQDRTHVGSSPNLSVTDNVIMKNYVNHPIGNNWVINFSAAEEYASGLKDEYEIKTPNISTPVRLLSGGNLQKVILAREISNNPVLMVAMQPTRGLDVGAIEGVQKLLLEQRENGAAILLISEELEELISLSDRIYVIYEGEIMGEEKQGNIDSIGMMMTGIKMEDLQEVIGSEAKDE
ncbi:MAG: ABC transporter ATP-binding protein [Anaerolineaceae bacterium]|nr:ABC transporter ATP-binding protein [Anaerolineaceae bacterium]